MNHFKEPSILKNHEGKLRHVGFELEFSNIDIQKTLKVLEDSFAFSIKKVNPYFYKLDSPYGEFILELDFELLTQQKLQTSAKKLSKQYGLKISQKDIEKVEAFIAQLSKDIVPYEISTPPLPFDKIDLVDEMVTQLSQNNAKGTKHKLYYAFGLHINVELISLDIKSILNYLRAYCVLQDFINKDAKIDLARKISPFIDNFKTEYIQFIMADNYEPSVQEFIDDYIQFNPTRNRSLDMLPILAFLDEQQVRKYLPDEKIKARPAFHYRLSNSRIGETHWQVSQEWNRWNLVEELANTPLDLKSLCTSYEEHLNNLINLTTWEEKVRIWLENH